MLFSLLSAGVAGVAVIRSCWPYARSKNICSALTALFSRSQAVRTRHRTVSSGLCSTPARNIIGEGNGEIVNDFTTVFPLCLYIVCVVFAQSVFRVTRNRKLIPAR